MYRKDKFKGIIAIILFAIIGISFLLFPDSAIPEYISIACFLIWLIVMYMVNKKEGKESDEE